MEPKANGKVIRKIYDGVKFCSYGKPQREMKVGTNAFQSIWCETFLIPK